MGRLCVESEVQGMSIESSPLRVLMVAASYFPYTGGVETHTGEVGRRLARAGVEVTVLTTDLSGQLPETEEMDGVQIRRVRAWPSNRDYYFAPGIYRFILQGQWDIVHCQGYHNFVAPLTMLAAQKASIPYVVSFHSGGDTSRFRKTFRGVQQTALRPLLARARRLICPSRWEADFFRKRLHLPEQQFVVIPNGASHLPVGTDSTQRKSDADGILIVSVGRLEQYKGHQRVIAALPKVREEVPDVRLRIVGRGPYESSLRKVAQKLGVTEYVEIQAVPPGDMYGMASLLARANLVTLLSEHEAQGIAVLEALALHRPVLVAGTSALQEFADRGMARAIPLKSTPEEVAKAVVGQLRQPLIPVNVELPTWDTCTSSLLALYQTAVGRVPLSCAS